MTKINLYELSMLQSYFYGLLFKNNPKNSPFINCNHKVFHNLISYSDKFKLTLIRPRMRHLTTKLKTFSDFNKMKKIIYLKFYFLHCGELRQLYLLGSFE